MKSTAENTDIACCLGGYLGLDSGDGLLVFVIDERIVHVAIGVALCKNHFRFLQTALTDQPLWW